MLNISERQIRSWERQGFVPVAVEFTFADLVAFRNLKELQKSRITYRKVGRAVETLRRTLPEIHNPLSELKITSEGRTVAVQIAGHKEDALTGQILFNFDAGQLGGVKSFPEQKPANPAVRQREAEAWFQRGLGLEEAGAPPQQAIEAYRKAVELNPEAAGALVNLGTIHYRMRKFQEAERYYKDAVAADPRYALAHFNLGNLYDEQGDIERAEQNYRAALKLNPQYADAHFNLALLCERKGDALKAVHHWKAYLKLDASSSWATIARKQLEKIRQATLIQTR